MSPRTLPLLDTRQRALADLRISVTDRCNFRCRYCMPRESYGPGFKFLPRPELLSFEEIARVARICVEQFGVRKLRLTGGEPLLRSQLHKLVAQLTALGVDLALTTNGSRLAAQAEELTEAGLDRVTVSLDSLDDAVFRSMNDADFPVASVLEGIEAADRAGLGVKINAVVRRGVNDHTIVPLVRHFRGTGHTVRLIEFMDVGITNGWRMDHVVPARELLERIEAEMPLEPLDARYPGEVARRYRHRDGGGEIGLITSVSAPFCASCTRLRLAANGHLYTCLFASGGTDIRGLLRADATDADVVEEIERVWRARDDSYSERRSQNTRALERVEMSYIGG